jgi:glycosyltransferase involved in cell wall biosynthesis
MSEGAQVVFVNNSNETFTPTQSGALATYIWECCRAALGDEVAAPWVVSRPAPTPSFPWQRLTLIDYPARPSGRTGDLLTRVQRRTTGLPQLGQRAWAGRVAKAVRELELSNPVLLLQNDPEVAVYLRKLLPRWPILFLFQNQLPAREPFRSQFATSVDAVAAVSDFTAGWVAEHYGLPRAGVTTVYSGVDSAAIRPPTRRAGQPVIGFVGRTGIEKAPDTVLEAALRLTEATTEFAVQIVGSNHWDRYEEDDYQRRLNSLVDQLVVRGIVVDRPGHIGRPELPTWLQRSWIHVVPSRWDEPFGLTTLEGMAAGNAVVASRTGGTPEVVANAGQMFDRDDADGLAKLLHRLVTDADCLEEWGQRARRRAEEMTWQRTYEDLWQLAAEAASVRRRAS